MAAEVSGQPLAEAAAELVGAGWEIFPLADREKHPRMACARCLRPRTPPSEHGPGKCRERRCQTPKCAGPHHCGHELCHGVLDATSDPAKVADWWRRFPRANIGARVPAGLFVLDVDPRHDGRATLGELQDRHGPLPATLTATSGRGDGGSHRYFVRPPGELSTRSPGPGLDIKTHSGYCVAPPSIHPDSGRPYAWVDPAVPPATAPGWLVELLRPAPRPEPQPRPTRPALLALGERSGPSIADSFGQTASWADILRPHGWTCLDHDPDGDGARWRHPDATHPASATIRHGCLFVYSTATDFEATGAGDPHGYTRFHAYAVLNHNGDMVAAARQLRSTRAAS